MLSEKTLSKIRGLGLNAQGYLSVCVIVQEAIDENRPSKQTTSVALTVPADWPGDYFEQFYSKYPNKKDPKAARKALDKVAFAGKTRWAELIAGLERYILSDDVQRGFVKHPTTFLNKGSWMNKEQTTPKRVERPKSFFEVAAESHERANGAGTDQSEYR